MEDTSGGDQLCSGHWGQVGEQSCRRERKLLAANVGQRQATCRGEQGCGEEKVGSQSDYSAQQSIKWPEETNRKTLLHDRILA